MKTHSPQKGAAMMIAIMIFLVISLTAVLGISTPILKQVQLGKQLIDSKESYFLAAGGLEDGLYRVKNSETFVSGETITLNGYTTTLTLTTTSNGRTIEASSDRGGLIRKMQAQVTAGTGVAFNYGIQTGSGGFVLEGGSRVNGNVYSNGDIVATGGVVITGSAVAANSAALTPDQLNDTSLPATGATCTSSNCLTFANSNSTQDVAQSFQVSSTTPIHHAEFYIKKSGTPANITVNIVTDNNGSPSTNVIDTATLSAGSITTSFAWIPATFTNNVELQPNTTYWMVLDGAANNSSRYYMLGANTAYAAGTAKIYNGSSWTTSTLDGGFKFYLGGLTSTIGGATYATGVYVGTAGIGDAWANTVKGATVAGNLYCQTGTNNNKSCNTIRPDPSPQGFPISDANIQEWKDAAADGWTYNGNLTVGWQGTTTGPMKVNGNLTVNGGGTMTLSGTVWVTGTVTVTGGGKINLASSYGSNSGVMVADGRMDLGGGGAITGSGTTGSYILMLTTSDCPMSASCNGEYAMDVGGGAGAVVLNAQNGTMSLDGGVSAREATAYKLIVSGGSTITYDSGLANLNFSSGPSGGWNITKWVEVQ